MFGKYSTQIPKPQAITNHNIVTKPKPIFVMRFRNSLSDSEFKNVKDTLYKSDISNEYHIIAIKNFYDKDEFEMFNADKIDRQTFNQVINQLTKIK